ncbi:hypothetical protein CEE45_03080 [Candidatus Heimdallarchaeota archaeon B3_Heim]|nr:MAG: hypothetical protein CEE45_03080 [Candidatus Heimdallarchaeota archaeon B3_Heim]
MILREKNQIWRVFLFSFFIGCLFIISMFTFFFSEETQYSSNYMFTLIIGNIIPIAIACLLIFYELNIFSSKKKTLMTIKEGQVLFIPRFNLYLSIFECSSVSDVFVEGVDLLNGLNRYSIEIDGINNRLRLFFYSNSKIELSRYIEEAKPLLDTIFPNLLLLTASSLKEGFLNYSLKRMGDYRTIKQGRYLIIPEKEQNIPLKSPKNYTHVINYNSQASSEEKSNKFESIQLYSFIRFEEGSFFDFFGRMCFTDRNMFFTDIIEENLLLRAIIRYKLVGFNSISDNEGITNLQQKLNTINVGNNAVEYSDKFIPPLAALSEHNPDSPNFVSINQEFNQICRELCNISRSSVDEAIKTKNCVDRASFCKKLLVNQNFATFLSELVDGEDDQRKDTILSDLLRHLSFHQIHCLLAQFIASYNSDNLDKQIIKLLHVLIQKQLEINSFEGDSGRNHFSVVESLHQRLNHGTNIA